MVYIPRYIEKSILSDIKHKMVFIGGPRQTGKTTLVKKILTDKKENLNKKYLNWDSGQDREIIIRENFPAEKGYIILDEIHKYSNWRQILKGLYDKRGKDLKIFVIGSARLDYYRRGGDSLQGRYHFYRLLPLTFAELKTNKLSDLMDLLKYGGFPEQYIRASEKESGRWSKEYRTRVIQDDLRDLETVSDLGKLEHISIRLPELVGSPLSINALREDIQTSHQTVTRWLNILENIYMIFRIYPFGGPKIRAVKKEAKHYHYDWNLINDAGPRFENLIAVHLLKWCYFMEDSKGKNIELRYFRDIDRREVDFIILENNKPIKFIECKLNSKKISLSLKYLKVRYPKVEAIQIVLENNINFINKDEIHVISANNFLSTLI